MLSVHGSVMRGNYGPEETIESAYLADAANGATVLQIATAQSLEAICHCVGEFSDASVLLSNQYPTVRIVETEEIRAKTAADHVLIHGKLVNDAAVSVRFRGGCNLAIRGCRVEISGTEGDLVLSGATPNMQWAALGVSGARKDEHSLRALPVPDRYLLQPPGLPHGPAQYLAHNYQAFQEADYQRYRDRQ